MNAFQEVGQVFVENVLPILLIAGLGFGLQRWLRLELQTLNRLNLYAFVPALVVSRLLHPDTQLGGVATVALLVFGMHLILMAVTLGIARLRRLDRATGATLALGAMYANGGNFGLPLMELAFGVAGVGYQAVVVTVGCISQFTLGLGLISMGRREGWRAMRTVLGQPVIYALGLAFLLRTSGIQPWRPLGVALDYVGDGLIPVALVTLGAQLAEVKLNRGTLSLVSLSALLRLVGGPLVMFALVRLLDVTGLMAQVLIVGAAAPTAVNTAILSLEFDSRPEVAASTVFVTTVLCCLPVTVALVAVRALVW